MADLQTPPNPSPASKVPAKQGQMPAPTPVLTPDARGIEQAVFNRRLAADDAAREKAETLDMIAISSFTLFDDDPEFPDGRVINAGDEFPLSAFDERRYHGRARRKVLPDPNPAGVTSNRE